MGDRRNSDFQNLHRNKRSLTLDLKLRRRAGAVPAPRGARRRGGREHAPAVKHRLGVDYEAVRAVNPRIVYASISAFGQDGPGSQRGGVDQIAQGMGGLMSVTGAPDGEPVRAGYAVTDLAAGLHAAVGILVALHDRDRTGEGAWVHTSLLEAAIGLLDFQAARYTVDGVVPPRVGNHHPTLVPMGTFATADGHVNIAAIDGRIWLELTRVLDLPELLEDPRFATVDLRMDHRDEINALVAARLRHPHDRGVDRRPGGRGRPRRPGQRRRRGLRRRAGPAPGDGPAGRASRDGRAAPHRQRRDAGRAAAHAAHRGAGRGRAHARRSSPSSASPPPTSRATASRGPSDARAPAGPRRRRRDLADVRPRRAPQRAVDRDVPLAARRARAHRARPRGPRRRAPRRRRRRVHVRRGHLRAGRPGGAEGHHAPGTRRWRR